jgi:hypothetical protein
MIPEEHTMDIGEVIKKSWEIIWKHKILWGFGILAGCVDGGGVDGGGARNAGLRGVMGEISLPFLRFLDNLPDTIERVVASPQEHIGTASLLVLGLCVFWLALLLLGTIGRIGLIRGALQADKSVEPLHFADLWQDAMHYFWKVLGLWIILWLAGFVLLAATGAFVALVYSLSAQVVMLCLLFALCFVIPLAIFVNLIFEQATIALIKEEHGVIESLQRAWGVIQANLGVYLLMVFLLFIVQLAVGFLAALPLNLVAVPIFFADFLTLSGDANLSLFILGLCFMVYMPILLVLNGALRAYIWTAWTLTFNRLSTAPLVKS